MECRFEHVGIAGIAAVVPPRSINIDDELEFFQNNPKKLERTKNILGLGTRHVVDIGVTATDLCEDAARRLMAGMGESFADIDTLILVNQSPDHQHPSGSCILHGRLELPKSCATLDISLGCSGYVYGLWLAHALISSGASQKLLLCAGDTPSLHSSIRNRLVNPLFGDAGAATLLVHTHEARPAYFCLGSDGSGWHSIAVPAGGFRLPITPDIPVKEFTDSAGNPWKLTEAVIDGMAVFDFTLHEVPPNIARVLEFAGNTVQEIDFFALHQANKQIVRAIAGALSLPDDKIYWNTFSRYGNQSTASVACVLCDALEDKMPANDLTLLLSGFGVGLSWASAIVQSKRAYNGGISLYSATAGRPNRAEQEEFWKNKFMARPAPSQRNPR